MGGWLTSTEETHHYRQLCVLKQQQGHTLRYSMLVAVAADAAAAQPPIPRLCFGMRVCCY